MKSAFPILKLFTFFEDKLYTWVSQIYKIHARPKLAENNLSSQINRVNIY